MADAYRDGHENEWQPGERVMMRGTGLHGVVVKHLAARLFLVRFDGRDNDNTVAYDWLEKEAK